MILLLRFGLNVFRYVQMSKTLAGFWRYKKNYRVFIYLPRAS